MKRRTAGQERSTDFLNEALLSEKLNRKYDFGDLAANERICDKKVLQKEDLKSGWHSAGLAAGYIESRHESSYLLKCS
jgi:hypothetical protein